MTIGDVFIDSGQADLLPTPISQSQPATIIYMEELSFYYYLINGGLDYGAIYYPAIQSTLDESVWLTRRADEIRYLVSFTPIRGVNRSSNGSMILQLQQNLIIKSDGTQELDGAQVFVGAHENQVTLSFDLTYSETSETTQVKLPPGEARWVDTDFGSGDVRQIAIRLLGGAQQIEIGGIRFGAQTTNWPWNKGISLVLRSPASDETVIKFSHDWLANGLPLNLEVINDNGVTILARVVN